MTYQQTRSAIEQVTAELAVTHQPIHRHHLLLHRADLEAELAAQHSAIYGPDPIAAEGGRDMAQSLQASAELLRLAAFTELSVALSEWTPAEDLREQRRFWRHGWQWVHRVEPGQIPGTVTVHFAGGGDRVVFGTDELVRTSGPDDLEVIDLAREAGADWSETRMWTCLAVTASRYHRAAMLGLLIAPLAAQRVGDRATGVLRDLADGEERLFRADYGDDAPALPRAGAGLVTTLERPERAAQAAAAEKPAVPQPALPAPVPVPVVALAVLVILAVVLDALPTAARALVGVAAALTVAAVRPLPSRGGGA